LLLQFEPTSVVVQRLGTLSNDEGMNRCSNTENYHFQRMCGVCSVMSAFDLHGIIWPCHRIWGRPDGGDLGYGSEFEAWSPGLIQKIPSFTATPSLSIKSNPLIGSPSEWLMPSVAPSERSTLIMSTRPHGHHRRARIVVVIFICANAMSSRVHLGTQSDA